ncbi:MAG TPA: hypothetical protein PKH81_00495 [Treponemataceae bacterium]|nr:hypothetical protein [Treponemataceae bacterium]
MKSTTRLSFLFLSALLLGACATGPDLFIAKQIPVADKADMLFRNGKIQYEEQLVKNDDLTAIPRVRKYFENTLEIDPIHPEAEAWIVKVDRFSKKSFDDNIAKAKRLRDKGKRSSAEDFAMVLAVKKAGDIKTFDKDLLFLRKDTSSVRKEQIQTRLDKLTALQTDALATTNTRTLARIGSRSLPIYEQLEAIDPGNGDAKKAMIAINTHITSLAQTDIDAAKKYLEGRHYGDAEGAILRAEKALAGTAAASSEEITTIKYQIYYRWASALYLLNKWNLSNDKVNRALAIKRTNEAVALKAKLNKGTAETPRDYDSEAADIIADIDAMIARGQLSQALSRIETSVPLMKKKENQDAISSRKAAVMEAVKKTYNEGIASYNEEDYEMARDRFTQVVRIQGDYEQAQAYLDRTNGKLKALSGSN